MEKFIYNVKRIGRNVVIETTAYQEENGGQELFDFLVMMTNLGEIGGFSYGDNGYGGLRYELKDVVNIEKTFILKSGGCLTIP